MCPRGKTEYELSQSLAPDDSPEHSLTFTYTILCEAASIGYLPIDAF